MHYRLTLTAPSGSSVSTIITRNAFSAVSHHVYALALALDVRPSDILVTVAEV